MNHGPFTIITGASSGIGKELARRAAREGRNLLLIARREERLKQLREELEAAHGITVQILTIDLAEPSAAGAVRDYIAREGIEVEALVNNAGFGNYGLFHQQPLERNLEMIRLNNSSLAALTRLLLPGMIERGGGQLLHVASTAGLIPGPLQAVYYASKAFVVSFSQAIAEELRGTGVTSTALCPGPVRTEFADVAELRGSKLLKQAADPQRVAEIGWKAMLKGKLVAGENGALLFMLRYLVPLLPRKMALRISRKTQEKPQG
jgi:hypothetical protein